MRIVEIKAHVRNLKHILETAKLLGEKEAKIVKQNDVFFNVNEGRLKLRKFESGSGELIFYNRPNISGPKLSLCEKSGVDAEKITSLETVLVQALGIKTTVKKIRHVFLVGQTRIHVDNVENLGNFVELEVVLADGQNPEEGEKIAFDLMDKLGINKEDLISGAYADLLQK